MLWNDKVPRAILGYTRRGLPIYPIAGGDGEGEGGAGGGAGNDDSKGGQGGGGTTTTTTEDPDEAILKDPKGALALIRKLRGAEKELPEVRKALKEFQDAKLSTEERSTKRVSELEAENAKIKADLQAERIRSAVATTAVKAGAKHPDDMYKLIDPSAVEFNDDGRPKNLTKLIGDLKKERPEYFVGAGRVDGGARGGTSSEPSMDELIRQRAGRH